MPAAAALGLFTPRQFTPGDVLGASVLGDHAATMLAQFAAAWCGFMASVTWTGTLRSTHYWDCNGQGCDSTTLQPWDPAKYWSPPAYSPQDPAQHGGPTAYGEKMWMLGAASDALANLLGPDDQCCGSDGESRRRVSVGRFGARGPQAARARHHG